MGNNAYYFRRKSNDKLQKMYNQLVVAESSLKEQYDRLKQLGCDVVQGYYFSKPIQASEVEKLPNPIK